MAKRSSRNASSYKKDAMDKIEFGAYQAVEKCMRIKPFEKTVIITDEKTSEIGRLVRQAALKTTSKVKYFVMEDFGKRPLKMPGEIMSALKEADVALYCADGIAGELKLFRKPIYNLVEKSNLRLGSMFGVDKQIMEQGMNADYEELKKFTKRVHDVLSGAKSIKVCTELGTELHVKVGKYKWVACDGIIGPGHWSNLPDGEVFTSPENIEGTAVIDGVLGDSFDTKYGCISKNPLTVKIEKGHAVGGTLRCANKNIEKDLQAYIFEGNVENSTRIGEFALGTNLELKKIIGNLLQDEKFPGVHIAFGDCYADMTGCPFKSDRHVDGVILKPTVIVDGFKLMDKGRYKV